MSVQYEVAAGIRWGVEGHGILVVDELRGRCVNVAYPRAAVWDALARGRGEDEAAWLLRFVGDQSPEAAADVVRDCVQEWLDAGWLQQCEAPADG